MKECNASKWSQLIDALWTNNYKSSGSGSCSGSSSSSSDNNGRISIKV